MVKREDIKPGAIIRSNYTGKTLRRIVSVGPTHAKVAAVRGKTAYSMDIGAIERYWDLEVAK